MRSVPVQIPRDAACPTSQPPITLKNIASNLANAQGDAKNVAPKKRLLCTEFTFKNAPVLLRRRGTRQMWLRGHTGARRGISSPPEHAPLTLIPCPIAEASR